MIASAPQSASLSRPALPARVGLALLLVCAALVYLPTLEFELLNLDDNVNLTDNPFFRPPVRVWELWGRPYKHLYIPLTYTAWAAVAAVFGIEPAAFHALNLATFVVAAALVYGILRRLVGSDWAALCGTAFFALHPAQVESVAWATSFKGLFGGTLTLAAFYLYLRAGRWRFAALGLFALSLLAKSTSLVLPAMIACWRYFQDRRSVRAIARELWPWFALAAVAAWIAVAVYPESNPNLAPQSWPQRARISLDALCYYLRNTFYPFLLCVDFGHSAEYVLRTPWTRLTAAVPVLLAVAVGRHYRRSRDGWLVAGALAYVVALAPTLGIKPHDMQVISTVCDRYLFLPLVGAAYLIAMLARRFAAHAETSLVAGGLLAIWTMQTAVSVPLWRNDRTFWNFVLSVHPASFVAHNNLGSHYAESGELARAEISYRRAVRAQPNTQSLNNLGGVLLRMRRPEEALRVFAEGLRIKSDEKNLLYNFHTAWKLLTDEQRASQSAELKELAERARAIGSGPPPVATDEDTW